MTGRHEDENENDGRYWIDNYSQALSFGNNIRVVSMEPSIRTNNEDLTSIILWDRDITEVTMYV